jgi:ABC-type antimicrobial peptide transport system permease subunit
VRYTSLGNLLAEVRREVASVDRNLPVFRVGTLLDRTEEALLTERLLAILASFFGGLALLLACVGLYGLMAYAVARRTGEIGIRLALGAHRGQIVWLVLRETLWLGVAGIAAGVVLAVWAAGFAKSLLYGVSGADPVAIAVTVGVLMLVGAIAAWMPARRALRVDPVVALRND